VQANLPRQVKLDRRLVERPELQCDAEWRSDSTGWRHKDATEMTHTTVGIAFQCRLTCLGRLSSTVVWSSGRNYNEMLNGEVIRLDGAIRMQPK
jgi:hypothetical protein